MPISKEAILRCPALDGDCIYPWPNDSTLGSCGAIQSDNSSKVVCPIMEGALQRDIDDKALKIFVIGSLHTVYLIQQHAKGNSKGWYISKYENGKFVAAEQLDVENAKKALDAFKQSCRSKGK